MWPYTARLERDLARWRANGWVTPDGGAAIAAEIAARPRGPGLATALGVLGAVLLGFAAMSFVAANWAHMSKLARLLLLLSGLWAAYGAAAWLKLRGMPGLAEAAVLAGVGLFGASIMLIAQMYHMEGNPPDAVLTWALGALLAALVLQSRTALGAALPLTALWSGWETSMLQAVHWSFLPMSAAVAAAAAWMRWRPGSHLAAALFSVWIVSLGYLLAGSPRHGIVVAIGLLAAAAAVLAERAMPRLAPAATAALGYAATVAFAGIFAQQFIGKVATPTLLVLAIATLTALVAMIAWAWRCDRKLLAWLGYAGFSVEILALYFRTIGTLLDTSLFFLAAGLIVIALAAIAWRLHAREAPSTESTS